MFSFCEIWDVDHDVFFCKVDQNFGPELPDLAVVRYGVAIES